MAGVLDRFRLDGRAAVVTGASSGLGVAFADAFAEAGADLVLAARRADRLAETVARVEKHGRRAIAVATDVSDPDQCAALAAAGVEAFGHLDILVNNAGLGTAVPATRETPAQFRAVVDVNLSGAYWMAQEFARAAKGDETRPRSIVNIASVLGLRPGTIPQAAYAATKAGLMGLTRDLAAQWTARKGIRVNALAPGYFPSEMTDALDPRETEFVLRHAPIGRYGELAEIASAALFLASDASSYITGITLAVDGGLSMH
jgi:NAD(P)-dependent dehydrogenase (short-subunit alcohol dehydrogenase family)